MKSIRATSLLLFSLWLWSSLPSNVLAQSGQPKAVFPVRIGMLADSQITTNKGTDNYGMRRRYADYFAKVAIRPAAVEYLAPLMLRQFLDELTRQKVDVILYLGDGSNSGCTDELNDVFAVLEKSREVSKIPSYYVIGNHDYLGTGNQVKMSIREKLCSGSGGNPPETKAQVIKRISEHNKASAGLDKYFKYREQILLSDLTKKCDGDDVGHYTVRHVASLSNRETKPAQDAEAEILLVDTSDYRDVDFKATFNKGSGCEVFGGWGLKGSLSFKNDGSSQIGEMLKLASTTTAFRLMASHYRPTNLNMIVPFNSSLSLVRDALGDLLSDGQNIWLSGHTHTCSPLIEQFKVGKTLSGKRGIFDGVNVGSTTDFDPHAVIVGPFREGDTRIGKSSLGYTKIGYPQNLAMCEKVIETAKQDESTLERVCNKANYSTTLGLDKSYRKKCFGNKSIEAARKNIDRFSTAASIKLGIKPDDVQVCLAYVASRNEGPVKSCTAPFSPPTSPVSP